MDESLSTESAGNAESVIKTVVGGKRVLFIATTYLDYLRIQQELSVLNRHAEHVDILVSSNKSYFLRLLYIYSRLLVKSTKQYDVVFIGFAPQLIQWCWWWKFKKQTVIIDFFISFYDTLVFDRKKFKENSLTANLLLKLDRFTINKSDLIIADTKQHAMYFQKNLGAAESKLMVLYLDADSRYYFPQKIAKQAEYQDKYVVFYFATVLPLQGVDVVIDAITQINNSNIHFVFVGPIDGRQKNKLFKQKQLTYYSWLNQTELANQIAQADLCLAGHFDGNIDKAKRTIPGKAYIFEAMGKLIVLGDNLANRERYPKQYKDVRFVEMTSGLALIGKVEECCLEWLHG